MKRPQLSNQTMNKTRSCGSESPQTMKTNQLRKILCAGAMMAFGSVISSAQHDSHSNLPKLPSYHPDDKAAQPGDIFVRTGPVGTIPHGGNYWGLNQVGKLHFDSIELRRTAQGATVVVPLHWTADPGPGLNFYRPLESNIPVSFQGRRTELKNLPVELKEQIRQQTFEADFARLGTSRGPYDPVGVFGPSNHCIDSLLEPWDSALQKAGVTVLTGEGKPASLRQQFLLFNTVNPMSWPSGPGMGAMGAGLPRVAPPYYAGSGFDTSSGPPKSASPKEGGVSMKLNVGESSFRRAPEAGLDVLRRGLLEPRADQTDAEGKQKPD